MPESVEFPGLGNGRPLTIYPSYRCIAARERLSTIWYLFLREAGLGSNCPIWLSLISENAPLRWSIRRQLSFARLLSYLAPPLTLHASIVANPFKSKVKSLSVIGSYGWSENTLETLAGTMLNPKVEVFNPVRFI